MRVQRTVRPHSMKLIWLVLGISGSGKSYFSHAAADQLSWFHYEMDLPPYDGPSHWGLRAEWAKYFDDYDIGPFAGAVSDRSLKSGYAGSVLSFPSNLIACLKEQHVSAALPVAKLVFFTGPEAGCLNSFLQREIAIGRFLPASSWRENNELSYRALAQPWIAPHVVNAFGPSGSRRSFDELFEHVKSAA